MLCLITNRKAIPHENLLGLIQSIKTSEIDRIILREKDLDETELMKIGEKIAATLTDTTTKLLINTNVNVAKRINAYGVHFPYSEFIKTKERHGITGVSVHSVEEAKIAESGGADYLIAGHVYQTTCKEGLEPRGSSFIRAICEAVTIPVIAIGGIKPKHVSQLLVQGVSGIAVMSSVNEAVNPLQIINEYRACLNIIKNT